MIYCRMYTFPKFPSVIHLISVALLYRFYKEEHAEESANYIHTRAFVEEKAPIQVLAEVANDLHSSTSSILATIAQRPKAIRAWRFYQYGYV